MSSKTAKSSKTVTLDDVSPDALDDTGGNIGTFEKAVATAKEIGIRHEAIVSEELDIPEFSDNPVNRCYYCKDPVTDKEHQAIKRDFGTIEVDSTVDDEDDLFDKDGHPVFCRNCLIEAEIDWEQEYGKQRDAFLVGDEYVESGVCLKCGRSYQKTTGESNVSRSGYCFACGFNP